GDAEADALMANQVFHHLDKGSIQQSDGNSNGEWAHRIKFLEEAYRVLKPGRNSPLILNVDSQEQLTKSYWFLRALEEMGVESAKEYALKFINIDKLTELMQHVGFKIGPIYSILNETMFREDVYNDYDGPFKEEWR
ncbi:class I SAM-dependent methyltransferase, partial [Salmonella sp. s54836]|uniref:class I SAM-dependent methyltransferase n=1 Tax=Salmonella sp. s54836 TaxID=3159673 RepID=UPI0039800C11